MSDGPLLVVAALAQELGAVRPYLSGQPPVTAGDLCLRPGRLPSGRELWAATLGVGGKRSGKALTDALAAKPPAAILGLGLAGGLRPDLAAGTAVPVLGVAAPVGEIPPVPDDDPEDSAEMMAEPPQPRRLPCGKADLSGLRRAAAKAGVRRAEGWVLTVDRIAHEPALKLHLHRYSWGAAAVDMEGYAWQTAAHAAGVPLTMLRVIIDEQRYHLPDLEAAAAANGAIGAGAVLRLVLRRPGLLTELPGLMRRFGRAQRTLRRLVRAYLEGC